MPEILQAEPALEAALSGRPWRVTLHEERLFLATAALLFVVSGGLTIDWCRSMPDSMPMPGGWTMSMAWMKMPGQTWAAASSEFFKLWIVMMVAMMLPSLVPMLLHYRRAIRGPTNISAGPLTAVTAVGYFFVWSVIGAVIYPVGVFLSTTEMRSPMLQRFVPLAIGPVLLLAGAMQLTPWKLRRLTRCRNATLCDQSRSSTLTAWRHGLHLGVDCSLCCIGFMIALMVTDLMSLTYMAAAAVAITAERFALKPQRMARMIGIVLVVAGGLAMTLGAIRSGSN